MPRSLSARALTLMEPRSRPTWPRKTRWSPAAASSMSMGPRPRRIPFRSNQDWFARWKASLRSSRLPPSINRATAHWWVLRIDGRTSAAEVLRQWAAGLDVPFLGALRETQLYVRCLEQGLTIFDLPPSRAAADLAQWAPILSWMRPVLQPPQAANDGAPAPIRTRVLNSRPDSLMPAQESLIHGSRLAVLSGARAVLPAHRIPVRTLPRTVGEGPEIAQFLKR